MRLPFTALFILLTGSVAQAETIAVLELGFGDTAPALQQQVLARLHAGLKKQGHRVLLPAEVRQRLGDRTLAPGCNMGPCLGRLRSAVDADQVLMGSVTGQGASYDVTLTLLEPHGGSVLAQVSDHCDVCTFEEASATVGRAVLQLGELAARQLGSRAWLVVRSKRPGADVRLDGVPLGKTPLRRLVAPGEHLLEVERRQSRALVKRRLKLKAGQTKEVDLALEVGQQPLPAGAAVAADSASTQRWLAWLTFGAGVSMSILGTVLLGVNDECVDEPECTESRKTRLPGIIFASAGLTSTVISGILFWREWRRVSRHPAAGVGLALGPNVLGVSYRATY